MSESKLERKVCNYARSQGWLVYKFVSPMNRGVPDRIFIRSGITLFIEFKGEGKKLTKLQSHIFDKIKYEYAHLHMVDTYEKGVKLLDSFNINK